MTMEEEKLKTLKELGIGKGDKWVLRSEAVKWVKACDSKTLDFSGFPENMTLGARFVLRKFFNLTEEDLA